MNYEEFLNECEKRLYIMPGYCDKHEKIPLSEIKQKFDNGELTISECRNLLTSRVKKITVILQVCNEINIENIQCEEKLQRKIVDKLPELKNELSECLLYYDDIDKQFKYTNFESQLKSYTELLTEKDNLSKEKLQEFNKLKMSLKNKIQNQINELQNQINELQNIMDSYFNEL